MHTGPPGSHSGPRLFCEKRMAPYPRQGSAVGVTHSDLWTSLVLGGPREAQRQCEKLLLLLAQVRLLGSLLLLCDLGSPPWGQDGCPVLELEFGINERKMPLTASRGSSHALSRVLTHCHTLSYIVTCCHTLSCVVTCCHVFSHIVTRYHVLSHGLRMTGCCSSSSRGNGPVSPFINQRVTLSA